MSPTPTGRLFGDDLVLTRTFRAPLDDVWASITDPARTKIGSRPVEVKRSTMVPAA